LNKVTRRAFVASLSAATVGQPPWSTTAAAHPVAPHPASTDAAIHPPRAYLFFDAAESRFIEPACARLIDPDDRTSGVLGIQVAGYLDWQLASPWGDGQRLYRIGSWQPGTLALGSAVPNPAQLFRHTLQAINREFERRGTQFGALDRLGQLTFLRGLSAGSDLLDRATTAVFFDLLLGMTVEGFFTSSPLARHRGVIAWPLKGFPGAYFRQTGHL